MSNQPEAIETPIQPWIAHRLLAHLTKVALAAWAGVAVLVVVAVRPDHLLVERIEFRGAERASVPALRHLAGMPNGTTIWGVDAAAIAAGVERHPWVKDASVRRAWPDRVVVDVVEYVPAAMLLSGGLYYVDADGNRFMEARGEDVDYPVITGIEPQLGEAHPDLPRVAARDALKLVIALDERGLVDLEDVSEVAFSPARGFTVVLRHALAARLVFGLEDHDRELARLARLVDDGLDLTDPVLVDLAPARIAIVRPLNPQPPIL